MIKIGRPSESVRGLYYHMWFQGGALIRSVEADTSVSESARQDIFKVLARTQAECGAFGYDRRRY